MLQLPARYVNYFSGGLDFVFTLKAFANLSPGFEHRENPGTSTSKGVVHLFCYWYPQGCRWRSNPWAEIIQRLRRMGSLSAYGTIQIEPVSEMW
jgi:hypothetical protein